MEGKDLEFTINYDLRYVIRETKPNELRIGEFDASPNGKIKLKNLTVLPLTEYHKPDYPHLWDFDLIILDYMRAYNLYVKEVFEGSLKGTRGKINPEGEEIPTEGNIVGYLKEQVGTIEKRVEHHPYVRTVEEFKENIRKRNQKRENQEKKE